MLAICFISLFKWGTSILMPESCVTPSPQLIESTTAHRGQTFYLSLMGVLSIIIFFFCSWSINYLSVGSSMKSDVDRPKCRCSSLCRCPLLSAAILCLTESRWAERVLVYWWFYWWVYWFIGWVDLVVLQTGYGFVLFKTDLRHFNLVPESEFRTE